MRFTWDPRKAAANVRKHGVTFEEAVTVFADPLALLVTDAVEADREILIGESVVRRVLVTVFIEIGAEEARIVSPARNQERKEEI